jgi:hypothetical protein
MVQPYRRDAGLEAEEGCMRTKSPLYLLAVTSMLVACTDVVTPTRAVSPTDRSSHGTSYNCSDPEVYSCEEGRALPPPPSLDTVSVVLNSDGSALSGAPELRVQYFMNIPQSNGWITFKDQTSTSVLASSNARITVQKGAVSGRGTLTVLLPGSDVISFNLATAVSGKSTFNGDCAKGCATLLVTGTLTPKLGTPVLQGYQLQIAPPGKP